MLFAHFILTDHFLCGKILCRNLSTGNIFCSLILMLNSPICRTKRCSKDFIAFKNISEFFFFIKIHFTERKSERTEFFSEHIESFFYGDGIYVRKKRINKRNKLNLLSCGFNIFPFKIDGTKFMHFFRNNIRRNGNNSFCADAQKRKSQFIVSGIYIYFIAAKRYNAFRFCNISGSFFNSADKRIFGKFEICFGLNVNTCS